MNVLDEILKEQKEQKNLLNSVWDFLSQPAKEDKYYSPNGFAEKLGVHTQSVRNAIKDGRITAKKMGRRILIHSSEFDSALHKFKSLKHKR